MNHAWPILMLTIDPGISEAKKPPSAPQGAAGIMLADKAGKAGVLWTGGWRTWGTTILKTKTVPGLVDTIGTAERMMRAFLIVHPGATVMVQCEQSFVAKETHTHAVLSEVRGAWKAMAVINGWDWCEPIYAATWRTRLGYNGDDSVPALVKLRCDVGELTLDPCECTHAGEALLTGIARLDYCRMGMPLSDNGAKKHKKKGGSQRCRTRKRKKPDSKGRQ